MVVGWNRKIFCVFVQDCLIEGLSRLIEAD